MRLLALTDGRCARVDDEHYVACLRYKWHYRRGYAVAKPMRDGIREDIFLHHYIGRLMGFKTVPLRLDHRDGDGLNNQSENLREASASQNRSIASNNTTGYKGVSQSGERFVASIYVDGMRLHLGRYDTAEQASEAYQRASRKHFGEFHREP